MVAVPKPGGSGRVARGADAGVQAVLVDGHEIGPAFQDAGGHGVVGDLPGGGHDGGPADGPALVVVVGAPHHALAAGGRGRGPQVELPAEQHIAAIGPNGGVDALDGVGEPTVGRGDGRRGQAGILLHVAQEVGFEDHAVQFALHDRGRLGQEGGQIGVIRRHVVGALDVLQVGVIALAAVGDVVEDEKGNKPQGQALLGKGDGPVRVPGLPAVYRSAVDVDVADVGPGSGRAGHVAAPESQILVGILGHRTHGHRPGQAGQRAVGRVGAKAHEADRAVGEDQLEPGAPDQTAGGRQFAVRNGQGGSLGISGNHRSQRFIEAENPRLTLAQVDLQGVVLADDEACGVAVGGDPVVRGNGRRRRRAYAVVAPCAGDGHVRGAGGHGRAGREADGHRRARGDGRVPGGRAEDHRAVQIVQTHGVPQALHRAGIAEGQPPIGQGPGRRVGDGDVAFQARSPVLGRGIGNGHAIKGEGVSAGQGDEQEEGEQTEDTAKQHGRLLAIFDL